jgi:hypothetical protein
LFLCLIKYHAIKTDRRSESIAPPFLTSALDRDECFVSRHGCISPGETAHSIREEDWVVGVDAVEMRKISYPRREWNRDSSVVQIVAYSLYLLSYSGFPIVIDIQTDFKEMGHRNMS